MAVTFDRTLDMKGAMCPQPILQSRKAVNDLPVGEVLQVVATDRGSVSDFQGWAKLAKNIELVGQETEVQNGKTLYVHYVKRIA